MSKIQEENLEKLSLVMSELEELYGKQFYVTSGFRTKEEQLIINPAVKFSAHLSGEAVDVSDVDKSLWGWIIENLETLIRLGIYVESKVRTPRHVHFQIREPASKNRIFNP